MDLPLTILLLLLAGTLTAFSIGWFHYPFGLLILVVLIMFRLFQRSSET